MFSDSTAAAGAFCVVMLFLLAAEEERLGDEDEYSSTAEETSTDEEESDPVCVEVMSTSRNTRAPSRNGATSTPQRKRARITQRKTKPVVKWSRGDLKHLISMPPDVFLEIARHLTPPDLLALARSTKFFRSIFMSRSSALIWQCAMNNVVGLPPCPSDLCAPQYTSLIYSKTCSVSVILVNPVYSWTLMLIPSHEECGARVMRRMDTRLHVRLCAACRGNLVQEMLTEYGWYSLLPISHDIHPERAGVGYCLTRDFRSLEAAFHDPRLVNDELLYNEWHQQRQIGIEERNKHAACLDDFLDGMEDDRANEIQQLKEERRLNIEKRLFDAGWTSEDMDFPDGICSQWNKLVLRPQPLTDRSTLVYFFRMPRLISLQVWSNLYPKLVPLLEANRDRNEQST
ncbi:hypothetical protein FRC12_016942 [Ceratobasidium sp. 428]|nr:hypothetical protein FRC12_016942 [Ceratobasidium sp. 428]